MPVRDGAATDTHEIVRVLRVVRGTMRFVVECRPRFDYGRAPHTTETTPDGVVLHGPGLDAACTPSSTAAARCSGCVTATTAETCGPRSR